MTHHQKVTHDQTLSATREEGTGANSPREPSVLGYPKDNLPGNYFSNKQSVLEELIVVWNKLFKRGSTS